MTDLVDATNFKDLGDLHPEDVVARTGCKYDNSQNQYKVHIWGRDYFVRPDACEIFPEKEGPPANKSYLYLFILFYLMKSKDLHPSGEWVSEKDILGGAAFFRGPHAIPANRIARKFDNDLEKFKQRCEDLDGTPISMADAAFSFQITDSIPVAVLYWLGDDDFESEAKLLFDKSIEQHLPLDIIYALAVEVCNTVAR